MTRFTTIGFDADDTLWHNERFYRLTQDEFARLLSDYAGADHLHDRLLAAERRNQKEYAVFVGYLVRFAGLFDLADRGVGKWHWGYPFL